MFYQTYYHPSCFFLKIPNGFYITKICNQVAWVRDLIQAKDFIFKCQDFSQTIAESSDHDIIYCDPPYIDRNVDYYNGWDESNERKLSTELSKFKGKFILSTWHHNDYRENEYIKSLWSNYPILTRKHFYHVGGKEENRSPIIEALVSNFSAISTEIYREQPIQHLLI